MTMFDDRKDAGEKLAKLLKNKIEVDTVVIPYSEASEVGLELAEALDARVTVRLSEFISAHESPHLRIGAVTEDGTVWIEEDLKNQLEITRKYIENTARIERNSLKKRSASLKQHTPDVEGENVVIVSDGMTTGFREAAVAGSLLKNRAKNIYVASPVKSNSLMTDIDTVVDGVFALHELPMLHSPEACYREYPEKIDRGNKSSIPVDRILELNKSLEVKKEKI